jgi:hypothetical protein
VINSFPFFDLFLYSYIRHKVQKAGFVCWRGIYIISSPVCPHDGTHLLLVCDKKDQKDLQTCLFFVFLFFKRKKKKHFLKNIQGLEVRRLLLGWGATVKS